MLNIKYTLLCAIIVISFVHSYAAPTPYSTTIKGKLTKVIDGDTIRIEGHKESFRMYGIDAAEKKQPCAKSKGEVMYGEVATNFLKSEILDDYLDTVITCEFNNKGRYGRPLATCFAKNDIYSDINLNKLMVFRGRAFADRKYAKDAEYIKLEVIAKKNQWGMWGNGIKCENPAEFRKNKKKKITNEKITINNFITNANVVAATLISRANT